MDPLSSQIDRFRNVPSAIKLEIASFVVDCQNFFENRAIFQVNKQTRSLESQFIEKRPNKIILSTLRKIASGFKKRENMQSSYFACFRKYLPCLFTPISTPKPIPGTLISLLSKAICKTDTLHLASSSLISFFMRLKTDEQGIKDLFPHVRKLNLANSKLNDEQLQVLVGMFPKVTELDMGSCLITDHGIQALTQLHLTSLSMANCNKITGISVALLATKFPKLVRVDLSGAVTDVPEEHFEHFKNLFSLKSLSLAFAKHVGEKTLAIIGNHLVKLRTLDLQHCPHVEHHGVQHLGKLKKLRSLNLSHTQIEDHTVAVVQNMPKLKSFSIERCLIGDEGIQHLANHKALQHVGLAVLPITNKAMKIIGNHLPRLTSLDMAHCANITDEGIEALHSLPKLKKLSLNGILLGDRSLRAIAQHHLRLKTLIISSCESFTYEGVQALESLLHLSSLDVSNNHAINDMTVSWISTHLPKLKRFFLDHCPITDAGLQALGLMKQLTDLSLSHTPLTNARNELESLVQGLPHLAALHVKNCPLLQHREKLQVFKKLLLK
jgi:Leucine-rich repeat (LRR) protein